MPVEKSRGEEERVRGGAAPHHTPEGPGAPALRAARADRVAVSVTRPSCAAARSGPLRLAARRSAHETIVLGGFVRCERSRGRLAPGVPRAGSWLGGTSLILLAGQVLSLLATAGAGRQAAVLVALAWVPMWAGLLLWVTRRVSRANVVE